ncbi:MAG: hypothetical protein ACREM1_16435 [Longimicrobiales bacterium]
MRNGAPLASPDRAEIRHDCRYGAETENHPSTSTTRAHTDDGAARADRRQSEHAVDDQTNARRRRSGSDRTTDQTTTSAGYPAQSAFDVMLEVMRSIQEREA